jgi:thioesterase domain-containing protein
MTRQLLEEHQEVESLTLLDSEAPDVMQARPTKDPLSTLVEACTTVARANGIDCHLDDERLRQLPEAEHRDSVLDALNEQGLHIDPQQFASFHGVFMANLSCYRSYRPVPLPRRIVTTLYRAMHTCRATPDLPEDHGWSSVFSEPIKIHDIEADHYSMLDSQHAPLIASRVVAAHQQTGHTS